MVTIRQHNKSIDFSVYDYVFEDAEKFLSILPFMTPKIEGDWSIIVIEPKLPFVRTCLDTEIIPAYLELVITIESGQLEQLYLERPNLVEKEKSNWEIYMDMVAHFESVLDNRSMYEIYRRCGPKEDNLRTALNTLSIYPVITLTEVNKHFAPVTRVYANQVVRSFLLGRFRQAWRQLSILEEEIGPTVAFYSMRKNIRHLLREKSKYLRNEDTGERLIENIDVYSLIYLYQLFETAASPLQLYPILLMFERRSTNAYRK